MSTTDEEPTLEPATPASFEESERQHRLDKLDALRSRGIEPYPVTFDRDATAAALHERHAALGADTRTGQTVSVAGRLTGLRRHGGLDFGDLRDETGTVQLLADRTHLGDEALEDFAGLDLGDWVGATGEVITTKTGELSIAVQTYALLAKALRPLPDLRHGLTDPDTRQRQRYLDLIANESSRRVFAIRSAAIDAIRQTFRERGFTEVETPVLLSQSGGASATPFLTHHNALNLDMTMRIALELPLKRLLVGGMNRVFEIGRVFRNEGIDTRHNPEFTELEAYQAFADYHDMMDLTEALVRNAAQAALGTTVVRIAGQEVDLAKPFRRATMASLIKENLGVDIHPSMPIEEARKLAEQFGVEWLPVWGAGTIMNELYDLSSEDKLIEPTFVMDHPKEISPLARSHRDDPWLVERFELVVAGRELANAYSELNDPVDQAARFRDQARMQAGGDEEAEPVDDDYVKALEYGLPPTGGVGIGIDRLIMLLAEVDAIRDVLLFPTLRPAEGTAVAPQVEKALEVEAEREAAELLPARPATPRPVTRRPASLFWISWATVGIAILAMLPSIPFVEWSFGIGNLLERNSRGVTYVLSAAAGVLLLFLARQLYLGKRRAWIVTVAIVAAATVIHILKGPDPIPVIANLGVLVALVWFRNDFRARTNPRSLIEAVAFVPLYLIIVGVFGFISLWTQANHVNPRVTFSGGLETIYGGLVGVGNQYEYTRTSFSEFFTDALLGLGILGILLLLYLLLRTFVQREPEGEDDRARARAIVERWGGDTLAYFALRADKSYFFSADGRSVIAYAYVRGFAMVAADPIGPPQSTGETLDEFLEYCRECGWSVAFLAVREADSTLYRERGMHVLYLGDEAVVHCDTFSLQGSKMKAVREAVNRVGRDHSFALVREDTLDAATVAQLNAISDEWREGAAERGFTMELGEDVEGRLADFVIAIARDRSGEPVGFLRFVPAYDPVSPGYSLDLMRRKPDSANGLTEFLIANAATALGQEGVKRLSLNFAAWGRLLDTAENAGFWGRFEGWVARQLNPYFQIQSLRDFNAKFDPEWYPRSMVVDDLADLPKVALLYASVEGFLEIPVLGKLLVPPVRQAAATGHVEEPAAVG